MTKLIGYRSSYTHSIVFLKIFSSSSSIGVAFHYLDIDYGLIDIDILIRIAETFSLPLSLSHHQNFLVRVVGLNFSIICYSCHSSPYFLMFLFSHDLSLWFRIKKVFIVSHWIFNTFSLGKYKMLCMIGENFVLNWNLFINDQIAVKM